MFYRCKTTFHLYIVGSMIKTMCHVHVVPSIQLHTITLCVVVRNQLMGGFSARF